MIAKASTTIFSSWWRYLLIGLAAFIPSWIAYRILGIFINPSFVAWGLCGLLSLAFFVLSVAYVFSVDKKLKPTLWVLLFCTPIFVSGICASLILVWFSDGAHINYYAGQIKKNCERADKKIAAGEEFENVIEGLKESIAELEETADKIGIVASGVDLGTSGGAAHVTVFYNPNRVKEFFVLKSGKWGAGDEYVFESGVCLASEDIGAIFTKEFESYADYVERRDDFFSSLKQPSN